MNPIDLLIVAIGCGVSPGRWRAMRRQRCRGAGLAAQGVLGVYTGLMVRNISFAALGSHWPIVVAIAVGTLVISVAGGALLGLHRDVSPLTGGLSLVAGGSSGLVAIARELGGDDRVVAAVQYLRVALIMAAMPVVVTVVFHNTEAHASQVSETALFPWYFSASADRGHRRRRHGGRSLGTAAGSRVARSDGDHDRAGPLRTGGGLTVPMLLVQAGIMLIVWQTVLGLQPRVASDDPTDPARRVRVDHGAELRRGRSRRGAGERGRTEHARRIPRDEPRRRLRGARNRRGVGLHGDVCHGVPGHPDCADAVRRAVCRTVFHEVHAAKSDDQPGKQRARPCSRLTAGRRAVNRIGRPADRRACDQCENSAVFSPGLQVRRRCLPPLIAPRMPQHVENSPRIH